VQPPPRQWEDDALPGRNRLDERSVWELRRNNLGRRWIRSKAGQRGPDQTTRVAVPASQATACYHRASPLHFASVRFEALPCSPDAVLPLRQRYCAEMHCQVLFYLIYTRENWTEMFALYADSQLVGFGTKAIAGPWHDRPTIIEFFVLPEYRVHVFRLFEALLKQTGCWYIETQSNGTLLAHMLLAWSRDVGSESILFEDKFTTDLSANGATVRQLTPETAIQAAIERRSGGGEWQLILDGASVGKGGILFHYNRPYGDLHMEIAEPFRGRGLGAYFVQELKRKCRVLGATPAARCNLDNIASRYTLQKAGFVPCGHLIKGSIRAGKQ
jgi:GNAT superfamily N-acetyltransferase